MAGVIKVTRADVKVKGFHTKKDFGFFEGEVAGTKVDIFVHRDMLTKLGFDEGDMDQGFPAIIDFESTPEGKWRATAIHGIVVTRLKLATLVNSQEPAVPKKPKAMPAESAPVEALPAFVLGETVEGVIRGYKAAKGFGFLRVEGRKDDLFIHVSQTKAVADVANGLTAICEVGENKQGFAALNVRLPGTEAPVVDTNPAPAKKPKLVRVPKKPRPEAAPKPAKKPKPELPTGVVASASPPEGSTVGGAFDALARLNAASDTEEHMVH